MSEKKTRQLLQLYFRESDRVRLIDIDALPSLQAQQQEEMQEWLSNKRYFSAHELTSQLWLKTTSAGQSSEIVLNENGSFTEYGLFNPKVINGTWQLRDGILDLHWQDEDADFTGAVVANRHANIHSAIEHKNDRAFGYFKLAQTRPVEL